MKVSCLHNRTWTIDTTINARAHNIATCTCHQNRYILKSTSKWAKYTSPNNLLLHKVHKEKTPPAKTNTFSKFQDDNLIYMYIHVHVPYAHHRAFPISFYFVWCVHVAALEMLQVLYIRHKPIRKALLVAILTHPFLTTYSCICTLCRIVLSLYPTFSYVVCYSQRMGQILYVVQAHCIYLNTYVHIQKPDKKTCYICMSQNAGQEQRENEKDRRPNLD